MRFFGKTLFEHSPEDDAAREEQKRRKEAVAQLAEQNRRAEIARQGDDLRALSQGGLPIMAVQRLKEIGKADADEILFTSDLTPGEAGLLRREGFHPRGMVTGSAMYHVGQAYASATNDCEVSVLSNAYDEATRLAVSRMRQELDHIGAHGVVGVRFVFMRHEWADQTIEVQLVGTAVEGPGAPPPQPWMSDLSGQEWYALHRAGYEPAALAWGHCTWFLLTTYTDEMIHQSWQNVELTHWSHGLGIARRHAMNRLKDRAQQSKATGVAGVRIERRMDEVRLTGPGDNPVYEREHHNLVVSIIGTAIRVRADAPRQVPATVPVLSLLEGRLVPAAVRTLDLEVD